MTPQRLLEDYAKALDELEQVLTESSENRLIQAGCIQYFEFCFELAWKSVKSVAEQEGLECHSPKTCLKVAHQNGWVEEEPLWLEMLASRNRMSHTCDSGTALNIYHRLVDFQIALQQLHLNLKDA